MSTSPAHILVANEIVSTEKSFVEQLNTLITVYIHPLQTAAPPIIDMATQRGLFSNAETLAAFNGKLLEDLVKDMEANPTERKIGKIFVMFAPFFKMFNLYLNNFTSAMKLEEELRDNNPEFAGEKER